MGNKPIPIPFFHDQMSMNILERLGIEKILKQYFWQIAVQTAVNNSMNK